MFSLYSAHGQVGARVGQAVVVGVRLLCILLCTSPSKFLSGIAIPPRGSCPPGPLRGAPPPNPHHWEGDDRGDVKPLGGAAHDGSPPPSGHRSVVKSSPSAGWLHCGPVGPGRCGRGGGELWFRRNHGSPFPPLRCRAALTWRRGLAPLRKFAVAFLREGVTRSPAISRTSIASSRNPRLINCSAPKDLPMWWYRSGHYHINI